MIQLYNTLKQITDPLINVNFLGQFMMTPDTGPNLQFDENYPVIWCPQDILVQTTFQDAAPLQTLRFKLWYLDQPESYSGTAETQTERFNMCLAKMNTLRNVIESAWVEFSGEKAGFPEIVTLDTTQPIVATEVANDFSGRLWGYVAEYTGILIPLQQNCTYESITGQKLNVCLPT